METDHERRLAEVVASILRSYQRDSEALRAATASLPSRDVIWAMVENLLRILFPGFLEPGSEDREDVVERTIVRAHTVSEHLCREIAKGLRFARFAAGSVSAPLERAGAVTLDLLAAIPCIRETLAADVEAAYDGDPAARSREEIILAYPGLQAIAVYRLAHVLQAARVPIVPRVMSEYAHSRTGIDIHPGARIGRRCFIDHGTGVVIGETCVIGDGVKIYQGVTLGARSFPRDERGRAIKGAQRHPEIGDDVTIYSGATILGPVRIGRGSVIGGNVWLTESVAAGSRIAVRTSAQAHLPSTPPDGRTPRPRQR